MPTAYSHWTHKDLRSQISRLPYRTLMLFFHTRALRFTLIGHFSSFSLLLRDRLDVSKLKRWSQSDEHTNEQRY